MDSKAETLHPLQNQLCVPWELQGLGARNVLPPEGGQWICSMDAGGSWAAEFQ